MAATTNAKPRRRGQFIGVVAREQLGMRRVRKLTWRGQVFGFADFWGLRGGFLAKWPAAISLNRGS
jgi:hypothetical protein